MEKSRWLAFLILLSITPSSAAEPKALTWPEAVQTALRKNPDLLAAQSDWESRRANYKGSYNSILPQVGLSSSYTESKNDTSLSNRWSARGTASLNLFNLSDYAGISSAHSSLDQAMASLRSTSADVLLSLRRAFANTLFSEKQIEVSEIIHRIRKNNANLVSLRYDSGRESKGNKLRANAEFLQSNLDLNQSHRDLKAAQQELNRQLGEEFNFIFTATGTLTTKPSFQSEPVMEAIIENHPQIAVQNAQLKSAQASLREAQSDLWPNLTANYTRSFQGRNYFPGDEPNWSAAGVVSLPWFGAGPTSTYYSVKESRRGLDAARENLRSTVNQVRSNLESTWSNFLGSAEQVTVQHAFLEAARLRNDEADIRYSSGLISYDDWERIVTERVTFEKAVIRAERDAVFAEAQWDNARGKELGETE